MNAAVDFLGEAVRRDPAFLAAYSELARAHDLLYASGIDHSPARLARGPAVVDAAMKIAPQSSAKCS